MNKPLVTIGMSVLNCEKTISGAIISLLNQTVEYWKLIVVDDGSSDNTSQIVSNFNDDRVVFFQKKETKGLPARLNEIIQIIDTEFFARMDGDDIAYPERLDTQLDYLQKHPEIDLVGTGVLVIDHENNIIGKRIPPEKHAQICQIPCEGISVAHPTFMAKTEWFKKHMYNSRYLKSQDQDLLLRTFKISKFANIPCILHAYRVHKKSLKKIILSRWYPIKRLLSWDLKGSNLILVVYGILLQISKLALDLFLHVIKIENYKLTYKAQPYNEEDEKKWSQVKKTISEKMD